MVDVSPHVHLFDFVFESDDWRCACGQTMASELMPEPSS